MAPEASANAYVRQVNPVNQWTKAFPDDLIGGFLNETVNKVKDIRLDGDAFLRLYVYNEKVSIVEMDMRLVMDGVPYDCEWTFDATSNISGPGNYSFDVKLYFHENEKIKPLNVRLSLRWDSENNAGDNFSISINAYEDSEVFSLGAYGSLSADYTNKNITANLKALDLALRLPQGRVEASFGVNYTLRADNTPIVYNEAGQMPLTAVNELNVLGMYAQLTSDPQLKSLIDMMGISF